MKRLIPFLILGASLVLSACSAPGPVTRDAPLDLAPRAQEVRVQNWSFGELIVNVPRSLRVSEANTIKPNADIVWRGDPVGNRYEQVARVMEEPLERFLPMMQGDRAVVVRLDMTRFHAQTQRVRYTFGGEHEIEFDLTISDAVTGEILMGPVHRDLTFRALGGEAALQSEARGVGQRERIHARLIDWAREEFGLPIAPTGLIY